MLQFNYVHHPIRIKLGLSMLEYCICDSVYQLSNNESYFWCIISRDNMAEFYGVSKRTIQYAVDKLISMDILKKNEQGWLRTTELWYNEIITIQGAKIAPPMQNLHTKGAKIAPVGVQKLHSRGAKIAPNIYIDNKIDIIKDNNTQTAFDINNGFTVFWDIYPTKKGKGAALKSYTKALGKDDQEQMHNKIMQGVDYYIDEIKHKGTDKQYIAHASTWLNQQRWDDEYTGPKYVNKNKKINNKPFIPLVMDYDKHTPTDQHDEVHGTTNTGSVAREHPSVAANGGTGLGGVFAEMQGQDQ